MYRTYYAEMPSTTLSERSSCRTVNVYREPAAAHRPISSICWQPDGGQRFAVTHLDVDFNRISRSTLLSYVWDVENANAPELSISPPYGLVDLQFNQREPDMLTGGMLSGQVAVWDRRRGSELSLVCPAHCAHRDFVRSVLFINTKSGREFFSTGPDGFVKWWDIRDMSEPTDQMILDVVKYSFDVPNPANASGASALEFEPTIPTRFMVGTENGCIIGGNRKGKTPTEQLPVKVCNNCLKCFGVIGSYCDLMPCFFNNHSQRCHRLKPTWVPCGRWSAILVS